jgi:hypothetical protein
MASESISDRFPWVAAAVAIPLGLVVAAAPGSVVGAILAAAGFGTLGVTAGMESLLAFEIMHKLNPRKDR